MACIAIFHAIRASFGRFGKGKKCEARSRASRQTRPLLQHSARDKTAPTNQPFPDHGDTCLSPRCARTPKRHDGGCVIHALADVQIEVLAEDAWLLRFGSTMDTATNLRVLAAATQLQDHLSDVECVPAYASLLLRFNMTQWMDNGHFADDRLRDAITKALREPSSLNKTPHEVTIPVRYGGDAGVDLLDVATHARMSPEEVVARHDRRNAAQGCQAEGEDAKQQAEEEGAAATKQVRGEVGKGRRRGRERTGEGQGRW